MCPAFVATIHKKLAPIHFGGRSELEKRLNLCSDNGLCKLAARQEIEPPVSNWSWVTTLPKTRAITKTVIDLGHSR